MPKKPKDAIDAADDHLFSPCACHLDIAILSIAISTLFVLLPRESLNKCPELLRRLPARCVGTQVSQFSVATSWHSDHVMRRYPSNGNPWCATRFCHLLLEHRRASPQGLRLNIQLNRVHQFSFFKGGSSSSATNG